MKGLCVIIFFILAGCQSLPVPTKQALENEGELYLYLQPLPQEAKYLNFKLATIAAVKETGEQIPLSLKLTDFSGSMPARQRFLAAGRLPHGIYRGLSVSCASAALKSEEGESALLVPSQPTILAAPFTVRNKKATFLTLLFKYNEAIRSGFDFTPSFALFTPGKPVTGVVGYVSNSGANTITVIDKQARQVTGVIATGREPKGLAFDQFRKRAYVALSGDHAIEVIDITTGDVINRILLDPADNPQELTISDDGKNLLATNAGSNTVSLIDPLAFLVRSRIRVGNGPDYLLIEPAGKRAFVFNSQGNTISIIDLRAEALVGTIATEPSPWRGQFNRQGDALYIINQMNAYLTVIDPASLTVGKRYYLGIGIDSLKNDSATDQVYAGKRHSPGLEVYETVFFNPIDYIETGGGAAYMTINADENNLWVVEPDRKALQVIDLISRKVVTELDVDENPYRLAVIGER